MSPTEFRTTLALIEAHGRAGVSAWSKVAHDDHVTGLMHEVLDCGGLAAERLARLRPDARDRVLAFAAQRLRELTMASEEADDDS